MSEESEEVKRIRAKMDLKNANKDSYIAPDLPDMEKSDKTEEEKQTEAKQLREKADNGAVGVVKKVMNEPEVQKVIKNNVNRQTFISGLFMAFLLIGFLEVSQAVKQLFNYTWQFDLVAGIVMITIGAVYMLKVVALDSRQKK